MIDRAELWYQGTSNLSTMPSESDKLSEIISPLIDPQFLWDLAN